ncbi:hypothetical protein PUV47_10630 [Pseudovibrio exalbescens]|uniref:hypothetical protein n=1 Tax=Pseudovibrio exalbescens TaxID=197461 RepID=UPI002365254B|nr:hypothetical protein [Pseudovibrio exalbescens]MDD7910373.1 hypothetical protein [Pseudovibrio exalbescens]
MQSAERSLGHNSFLNAAERRKQLIAGLMNNDAGGHSMQNGAGDAGAEKPSAEDLISEIEERAKTNGIYLPDGFLRNPEAVRLGSESRANANGVNGASALNGGGSHKSPRLASNSAVPESLQVNGADNEPSDETTPKSNDDEASSSPAQAGGQGGGGGDGGNGGDGDGSSPKDAKEDPMPGNALTTTSAPDTSKLNQQVVQAVQFTNYENANYLPEMISAPAEVMATQTAGHATQNAESYMNGIMQIAVAAQAVVAAKIAENPAEASVDAEALTQLQAMVTAAITAFGDASTTAGTAAKTIITDTKVSS